MADVISEETKDKIYRDIPGIYSWILKQLKHLKIVKPTPIQYNCIPAAIEGKDVIGTAKTGSGKTLAFVIPILQKLSIDPYGVFALVLTPTRELAFQIADQFTGIGQPLSVKLTVIVGGMDRVIQGRELSKSPHIVIATPGRLSDIVDSSPEISFKRIKFLVLDEADRLMDGRFDKQLQIIWKALPEKRQTLLFSATITDRLEEMRKLARSEVFVWQSLSSQATVVQLDEHYVVVNPLVKDAVLVSILLSFREKIPNGLVIVFTDTCKRTQVLKMTLNKLHIPCVCIHSMIVQKERLAALSKFKSSQIKILIATDVASRGLDIPLVELIVNHNVPNLPKTYIHRVGRTARAGRSGQAITLMTPHDIKLLLAIEAETRCKLKEFKVDDSVVNRIIKQVNMTKREQEIRLENTDFNERRNRNKRKNLIIEGKDPDEEEKEIKKRIKKAINKRKLEMQKLRSSS